MRFLGIYIIILSIIVNNVTFSMEENYAENIAHVFDNRINLHKNPSIELLKTITVGGLTGASQSLINRQSLGSDSYKPIIAQNFVKGLIEGLYNLFTIMNNR